MVDKTLIREIRRATKTDTLQEALVFRQKIRGAARDASSPEITRRYNELLKTHGRVIVALITAATIYTQRDHHNDKYIAWAEEIIKNWFNRPSDFYGYTIVDDLHPLRIEEYAGSFIAVTTDRS